MYYESTSRPSTKVKLHNDSPYVEIKGSIITDNTSSLCAHVADVGLVCPMRYSDNNVQVQAYQECDPKVKKEVAQHLLNEWGELNHIDSVQECQRFIERRWSSSDVLYVATKNGKFIGCEAIDRINFLPFISHLYVIPTERRKGYSKLLLHVAEEYIAGYGFSEARLWCKTDLKDFYDKRGYIKIENETLNNGEMQLVLVKQLELPEKKKSERNMV